MFGILYMCTDSSESVIFVDFLLVMVLMSMTSPLWQSSFRYEEFQMFHFTRKRFFRYQILLSILRAAEVALVRTGYQLMMREKFIEYYMEEGVSPQNRWRIAQQREKHPKRQKGASLAIKVVNFVGVVTVCVLMIDY